MCVGAELPVRIATFEQLRNAMRYAVLLLVLILNTGISVGQKYQYGVLFSAGLFIQVSGTIEVTDTRVSITRSLDERADTTSFQFVRKTNNQVFFTDGLMTHFFTITKRSGNQEGFEYDTLIVVDQDDRRADAYVSYYAKRISP